MQGLPTNIREAVHTVMSDPEAIPELPGPLHSAIVEILQPSNEVVHVICIAIYKSVQNITTMHVPGILLFLQETDLLLAEADTADPKFYLGESDDEDSDETMSDILLELGMKGEVERKPAVSCEDKPVLTKLLLALAMFKKSQALSQRAAELMEEIVIKSPNLKNLTKLFSLTKNFNPQNLAEAKLKTKYPQSFAASSVKKYSPRTVAKGEYKCRICSFTAKTWSGTDSHIRQEHSNIYYGPCPCCGSFKSSNQDVYRRHILACKH